MKRRPEDAGFWRIAREVIGKARYDEMKRFISHSDITVYQHSIRVALTAYRIAVGEGIRCDLRALVRGALLHDYYLYDWHDPINKGHATKHPLRALKKAEGDFSLTDRERNIISAHMWPLPPTRIPRYREAWLVCLADKWCSLEETLFMR